MKNYKNVTQQTVLAGINIQVRVDRVFVADNRLTESLFY